MTALTADDPGRLVTGMTAQIIRANALTLPLRDESVDLIVTSPPFFALRSYTDDGTHYAGQIGAEPTPAAFVDALLTATVEMVRVLKPTGSLWINLGDKYAGGGGQWAKDERPDPQKRRAASGSIDTGGRLYGLRAKSLIGVPWRYALRCIDELGLILRAEVIWSKPNGLPESVTDRVRRSHETWFHFTKSPRYYSAVDEIREAYSESTQRDYAKGGGARRIGTSAQLTHPSYLNRRPQDSYPDDYSGNPLGKLPGSVWTIATQPLKVPAELGIDHFAAFPMEWPRRLIRGWSPPGICTACGEGVRPTTETAKHLHRPSGARFLDNPGGTEVWGNKTSNIRSTHRITGYACACSEPSATVPAVVLDPFGGTGTTALMAKVLGRRGISVDMSADYCRLAVWRTNDPKQVDKATNPTKPKGAKRVPTPTGDKEYDRIRARHNDIPQDPLPIEVPDQPARQVNESKARPAKSVRFASCPKCLADREYGVIRKPDGTEVFRDHNKIVGKGRRMPCPGSGTIAPAAVTP